MGTRLRLSKDLFLADNLSDELMMISISNQKTLLILSVESIKTNFHLCLLPNSKSRNHHRQRIFYERTFTKRFNNELKLHMQTDWEHVQTRHLINEKCFNFQNTKGWKEELSVTLMIEEWWMTTLINLILRLLFK